MRPRRAVAALVASTSVAALLTACGGGDRITLTATFEDVGDMVNGHSVQIADVRVGEITGIELTDDFRAEVTMAIDGSLRVPADSVAVLRQSSLLGEKLVELRAPDESSKGPFLEDGDVIDETLEAPELEFVTEEAVNVLGGVLSNDLATLTQTGAVGFGERGPQMAALIDDLSVVTGTLAERTADITSIIDSLDRTGETLAQGTDELDQLLRNLADTTQVLSDNRDRTVVALEELTRLARIQNEEVFRPHLADVQRQITQVDAILGTVAGASGDVEQLLVWLERFVKVLPLAIPGENAQVYGWVVPDALDEGTPPLPTEEDGG